MSSQGRDLLRMGLLLPELDLGEDIEKERLIHRKQGLKGRTIWILGSHNEGRLLDMHVGRVPNPAMLLGDP